MTLKPFNLMIKTKIAKILNGRITSSLQGIEMSVDSDIQLIMIVTFTTER